MTDHAVHASLDRAARVAGLMFLLNLAIPALNWILVFSPLVAPDSAVETARNVVANELLFRVNVVAELVTSLLILVLAWALYSIVESVSRALASIALFAKIVEAALWAVIALAHVALLAALRERASVAAIAPERVQAIAGLFLNVHMPITSLPGVFLGLNATLFLYLLFRSGYVPRALAGFGAVSYALIFVYDLSMIVAPHYSGIALFQIVGWGPSIVFELVGGFWLLIRGIDVRQGGPSLASP